MRQAIIIPITVVLLLCLLVISIFTGSQELDSEQPAFGVFMFIAAMLGSVINQSQEKTVAGGNRLTIREQVIYFAWKILVALVFALFLYCAFMSEIITGAMFPKFTGLDGQYTGMYDYINSVSLATYREAAKMLIWAFIAGYAEKFVPNIIQQIKGSTNEPS